MGANNGTMKWYENDVFWEELFSVMFSEDRYIEGQRQVGDILKMTNSNVQTVLDLCCGPGCHSVQFALLGLAVTAVDLSPYLLAKAKEKADEVGVSMELIIRDMRVFCRPGYYDLACCLSTSFGYFESREENLAVLQRVHESLTRDGVFVLDMVSKESFSRTWQSAYFTELENGLIVIQRSAFYDDCSRIRNDWLLLKDGRYRSFQYDHAIYSGQELKDLLGCAGFASVQLFGNFDRSPYDVGAKRLIAVARKDSRMSQ